MKKNILYSGIILVFQFGKLFSLDLSVPEFQLDSLENEDSILPFNSPCFMWDLLFGDTLLADDFHIHNLTVNMTYPGIVSLNMSMTDITISGLNSINFVECDLFVNDYDKYSITGIVPRFTIYSSNYNMTGSLAGHIPLNGDGAFTAVFENFKVTAHGEGQGISSNVRPPNFHSVVIGFPLWRWFITLNGVESETDVQALLNSFLMQLGPEIFQILGKALNDNYSLGLRSLFNRFFEWWFNYPPVDANMFNEQLKDLGTKFFESIIKNEVLKSTGITFSY